MNAAELIREAYILAHVLDPNEEPEGYLMSEGLNFLNQTLSQWGNLGVYIPYCTKQVIDVVQGVYQYAVGQVIVQLLEANLMSDDNLLSDLHISDSKEANLFNFKNGQGRPACIYVNQERYFVSNRSSQLGNQIILFPNPDAHYVLTMLVKLQMQQVDLHEELLNIPDFYLKALRYQLAKDFVNLHGTDMPGSFFDECRTLERQLKATNPKDMSIKNENPLLDYRRFRPWGSYVG